MAMAMAMAILFVRTSPVIRDVISKCVTRVESDRPSLSRMDSRPRRIAGQVRLGGAQEADGRATARPLVRKARMVQSGFGRAPGSAQDVSDEVFGDKVAVRVDGHDHSAGIDAENALARKDPVHDEPGNDEREAVELKL